LKDQPAYEEGDKEGGGHSGLRELCLGNIASFGKQDHTTVAAVLSFFTSDKVLTFTYQGRTNACERDSWGQRPLLISTNQIKAASKFHKENAGLRTMWRSWLSWQQDALQVRVPK